MKLRITILFALILVSQTMLYGEPDRIVLRDTGQQHNHWELPSPAVQPEVYYDDVDQEIIIVGTGSASYYDVVIESVNDWDVSLSTQVNGNYGTIDISSLPADEYCITITTQWNDTFVGYFQIE